LNQSQLRGFSTAGQKKPAPKNRTATPASQGQPLPSCHQFNTVSTPRAAAMTMPKERSELRTTFSSREKLSCVVWVLMEGTLAFEGAEFYFSSPTKRASLSLELLHANRLIAEHSANTLFLNKQYCEVNRIPIDRRLRGSGDRKMSWPHQRLSRMQSWRCRHC
jgi:hypothetical protein